ncbi:MAG: endonuclease/exonuclease/phosphatase family protein [Gammaproteobacteria bacterium]|nr:endonuclease/exonuclease/phosphatase family protein [Gammaproteobacteria bacterium]
MLPLPRFFVLCTLWLLAACTNHAGMVVRDYAAQPAPDTAEQCAQALADEDSRKFGELNSQYISLVNWNIHKGADQGWAKDLDMFGEDPSLMIFQEAALNGASLESVSADYHQSFAPGYQTRQALTGVMTLSSVRPITQCRLTSREPWLRTPKATMITEYGLTGTDQTLLVINVHAINFALGVADFSRQIEQAQVIIAAHSGPVLLSGDFNTWRNRRLSIVQEMAASLGLSTLKFDQDYRKRAFGQPLDHIYVRGLTVLEATTWKVSTSDHNPMSVRFRM